MPVAKKSIVIEDTAKILATRAKNLSNTLSALSQDDLRILRRIWKKPDDKEAHKIFDKAVREEYTLQELRVALAVLDGVNELPLGERPIGFDDAQVWQPKKRKIILPPAKISTPTNETPPLPSVKAARTIADILIAMPLEDFKWLAKHVGDPQDLRSRLIIIHNKLYSFQWEDVAATIAALHRTLPSE